MKKQLLSLFLCLCMVFGMLPVSVLAAPAAETADTECQHEFGDWQPADETGHGYRECALCGIREYAVLDHISAECSGWNHFYAGSTIQKDDLIVTAYETDGSSRTVSDFEILNGENLQLEDTVITVSYTDKETNITVTADVSIIVDPVKLSYIGITNMPDRTTYTEGEDFDSTGMEVTAYYSNRTSAVVTGWEVIDGAYLSYWATSVTVEYCEDGIYCATYVPITVTMPQEHNPIAARFVRQTLTGESITELMVEPDGSIQVPDAGIGLQKNRGWISEDGSLYVASGETLTYAALLDVLGGNAEQGACVYFQVSSESEANQPQQVTVRFFDGAELVKTVQVETEHAATELFYGQVKEFVPEGYKVDYPTMSYPILNGTAEVHITPVETDPEQLIEVSLIYVDGDQVVSTAVIQAPKTSRYVDTSDVVIHLPAGYGLASDSNAYRIDDDADTGTCVARIPVVAVQNPVTVTFRLQGWGGRLKGIRGRTLVVTLNPGESVSVPYARGLFGRAKTISWNVNGQMRVVSGTELSYEDLVDMMGHEFMDHEHITFTGRARLI